MMTGTLLVLGTLVLGSLGRSPPFFPSQQNPAPQPSLQSVDVTSLIEAARGLVKENKSAAEKVLMKIFPVLVRLFDVDGDGEWTVAGDHGANYRRLVRYWATSLNRPAPVSRPQWNAIDSNRDGRIGYGELASVIIDQPDSDMFSAMMSLLFSRAADFNGDGKVESGELMLLMERSAHGQAQGLPSVLQVMPAKSAGRQSAPAPAPFKLPQSNAPEAPKPSLSSIMFPKAPQAAPSEAPVMSVFKKLQKLQTKIAGNQYQSKAILRSSWPKLVPQLDLNNDGRLTTFDLKGLWSKTNAYWQIYVEPEAGTAFPDLATWVRTLDANQDGQFSQQEFEAVMVDGVRSAFWMPHAAVAFMGKFDIAPQDGKVQANEIELIKATPYGRLFMEL